MITINHRKANMIDHHNANVSKDVDAKPVLCVDLDGTLLSTDILWESILVLLKKRPWAIVNFPFWLLRGKANFKRQVAQQVELNPAGLPIRQEILEFLKQERKKGRKIVLATASDQEAARVIAQYLGIFTKVIASDGTTNLAGRNKCKILEEHFGYKGFDYIGNSTVDLPVWRAAKTAILVEPSKRLLEKANRISSVQHIFGSHGNSLLAILKAMRIHQWVKNLLIFVPLLMAHKIFDIPLLLKAFCTFVAFSFCASSTYILNDLFDLQADRQHPTKKFRPLAAGIIPISTGVYVIPLMLVSAFLFAFLTLPSLVIATLGLYFAITVAYTFYLKSIAVSDVIVLAALYTLRIFAGGVGVTVPISAWLLAFSMFLFLSLAFMKRYAELNVLLVSDHEKPMGRGYLGTDKMSLHIMGAASGYLSVLVLALYINSQEVTVFYHRPQVLWLICPLLLHWITRMWFRAQRGQIDDEPILSTIKDPFSYVIGAIIAILLVAAL